MDLVKRQHLVVEDIGCCLLALTGEELTKGKAAEGIDHCLQVQPSHAFETADIKSILTEQISGVFSFNMAFSELGVGFFQKSDLLLGQLKAFSHDLFFEFQ